MEEWEVSIKGHVADLSKWMPRLLTGKAGIFAGTGTGWTGISVPAALRWRFVIISCPASSLPQKHLANQLNIFRHLSKW